MNRENMLVHWNYQEKYHGGDISFKIELEIDMKNKCTIISKIKLKSSYRQLNIDVQNVETYFDPNVFVSLWRALFVYKSKGHIDTIKKSNNYSFQKSFKMVWP